MTKEELKKEAEEWINKWELCNKCDHKVQCIEDNAMCPQVVERAYLASAEPREKRIEELEEVRSKQAELINKDTIRMENQKYQIKKLEQENAELEEKISVLLSCKNCPENKGGFICQKEYEDKCLAQKIQFIKELQEENAELKEKVKTAYRKGMRHMAKALKDYDRTDGAWTDYFEHTVDKVLQRELVDFEENGTLVDQLIKAKGIILMLYNAGRDVLMCRNEEKAYDNLSKAVNDKSIEQFISEVEK